jgi:hypothetical protein
MIKLKELINEHAWKRKFGEPLPTLETSTEKHKAKKLKEGVKDPKLKVGQKIRHKSDPRRLYKLKKITHGNSGIPEDPAGTSYMFVAPGNRKEYHTKKTWAQAIKKGWIIPESVNEGGMGILTSDQADVLQGIVMRNKNKNLKAILKVVLKSGYFKNVDKKELLGYIDGARQFVKYMKSHPMENRS